jgi:hypothetical protein
MAPIADITQDFGIKSVDLSLAHGMFYERVPEEGKNWANKAWTEAFYFAVVPK